MKSEGPSRRQQGSRTLIHQIAKEAVDSDGWVEIEGLDSYDATGVYNVIGRMTAQVVFRKGTMYARMERQVLK